MWSSGNGGNSRIYIYSSNENVAYTTPNTSPYKKQDSAVV